MKKSIIATVAALALAGAAVAAPASNQDKAFTIEGVHDYSLDSSGIRIGASLCKESASRTFTHEFGITLGYMTADTVGAFAPAEDTYIPLTLGYHASTKLTDSITAYAGGRVGVMKIDREVDKTLNPAGQDEDTTAPLITIGAGIKIKMTESANVRIGYEIGKAFPSDDEVFGDNVGLRTISMGLEIAF